MDEQRESLEVDVLFVGGGPASLAGAYHLSKLVRRHNESVSAGHEGKQLEPMIVVIDKGAEVGAHAFSGAVMDPIAVSELIPDYEEKGCPIEKKVTSDAVYYLRETSHFKLPFLPPSMSNHGMFVISLAKFCRWLSGLVENEGVNIFPGSQTESHPSVWTDYSL